MVIRQLQWPLLSCNSFYSRQIKVGNNMSSTLDSPDEPCECDQRMFVDEESQATVDFNSSADFQLPSTSHHLLKIPQEVLLHIFSFIDADYLLKVVANVCRGFKELLTNEKYWKIRLFKRFPDAYPIVRGRSFTWSESCKEREACTRIWKSSQMMENMITLNKKSGSAIDSVHLTKDRRLCICGGRDRSIMVWKLDPELGENNGTDPKEMFCKYLTKHNGWVWSITSRDDEICSTSFDTTVKFWNSETLDLTQSLNIRAPVLCSSYLDNNTVAVGCYNKKILVIDSRSGSIVQDKTFHRRAVLKVESGDNYIVSTGEDGLLLIIDRRNMDEVLQEIKSNSFAMALSSQKDQIWTGTKNGSILVYNAQNMNNVSLAADVDYGFTGKVTALEYTTGAVYSGSTDGWLKIFHPTLEPEPIATLELKPGGITDLSLVDKRLAVATGEGLVAIWDPLAR